MGEEREEAEDVCGEVRGPPRGEEDREPNGEGFTGQQEHKPGKPASRKSRAWAISS